MSSSINPKIASILAQQVTDLLKTNTRLISLYMHTLQGSLSHTRARTHTHAHTHAHKHRPPLHHPCGGRADAWGWCWQQQWRRLQTCFPMGPSRYAIANVTCLCLFLILSFFRFGPHLHTNTHIRTLSLSHTHLHTGSKSQKQR